MADIKSEYVALKQVILSQFSKFESALDGMGMPEVTSSDLHPLDDPSLLVSKDLFDARSQLVAALGQMSSLVQNPAEHLLSESLAHHTSAALSFIAETGIADVIESSPERQLHVDEIAKSIDSHPARVSHALRLLAHDGIFAEVREGTFANNRSSKLILGASPIKQWIRFQTWYSLGYSSKVADTWKDPVKSKSFEQIDSAANAAWRYSDKGYGDFWDWVGHEHLPYANAFADALKGIGSIGVLGILADYPWKSIRPGGVIVDVGGGPGHMLLPIIKNNPTLKGVLQDREEIVPAAKENFDKNLPGADVEFDAVDFFEAQPRKQADIYMLRWILHDWSDERAVALLKQQAAVMGPNSKIIIMYVPVSSSHNLNPPDKRPTAMPSFLRPLVLLPKIHLTREWFSLLLPTLQL